MSLLVATGVGAVGILTKFAAPFTNNEPAVMLSAYVSLFKLVLPDNF